MADQNIGQILKAFNSIEAKLLEQNSMLRALTKKIHSLDAQNQKLEQLIATMRKPSKELHQHNEFEEKVTQRLSAIEDKSRKTIELIKANSVHATKRAWP